MSSQQRKAPKCDVDKYSPQVVFSVETNLRKFPRVLNVIKMTENTRNKKGSHVYTLQTNLSFLTVFENFKITDDFDVKLSYFSIDETSAPIKKQG